MVVPHIAHNGSDTNVLTTILPPTSKYNPPPNLTWAAYSQWTASLREGLSTSGGLFTVGERCVVTLTPGVLVPLPFWPIARALT